MAIKIAQLLYASVYVFELESYLVIIFRSEILRIQFFQSLSEIIDDLGHIVNVNDIHVIIFMVIMIGFCHVNSRERMGNDFFLYKAYIVWPVKKHLLGIRISIEL